MIPTPHFESSEATVWHGDCIEVMRGLPDASVDAVVTDPPYGLEFMGREWDGADGFRRSLNPADVGRENVFGRSSRTSPEYRAGHLFQEWCELWANEALRVLKPGGHLLAFGGTRTFHRLAAGIEDAGFEIRDSIAWMYGSGFPKSLDVSKAIDKLDAREERTIRARTFQAWLREHMTPQQVNELTGTDMGHHLTTHPTQPAVATADIFDRLRPHLPTVPEHIEQLVTERTVESKNFAARKVTGIREMVDTQRSRLGFAGPTYGGTSATRTVAETEAHTEAAKQWQGWGTALKPAFEPIVVARKPLSGTVAANVLEYGTGALNIDASRVGNGPSPSAAMRATGTPSESIGWRNSAPAKDFELFAASWKAERPGEQLGRWPANVILDESQAAALDAQAPDTGASGRASGPTLRNPTEGSVAYGARNGLDGDPAFYGDRGGASRFFKVVTDLEQLDARFRYEAKAPGTERPEVDGTAHATVKPLDLMRWLVRLVTPKGGTVLEPFAGSGTTVEACLREGFRCIAIEREADYLPLIMHRVSKPHAVGLDFGDWEDAS